MHASSFVIYVPNNQETSAIATGSGVVGHRASDQHLLVHYEGNLHGVAELDRWEARVLHAASRLAARYPTIARHTVDAASVTPIGEFRGHGPHFGITLREAPEALEALRAWVGDEEFIGIRRRLSGWDSAFVRCADCSRFDPSAPCPTRKLWGAPEDGCSHGQIGPVSVVQSGRFR